ncbi:LOW QUALITY PROTEIN: uncharacterized protein LOC111057901 [Nilaparvata lugens]|uniref:LOW QUALITY PROTEIN: uncharacterized protein LOC111057901 n=1 Tax=Nilaparvata lugens TaxID=108931 RepID=UPI00193E7F70|nr:LOW QUALITY PROTEIN: uncharacterized protein LOC111057901 [Nilaparvata lugens]
MAYVVWRVFMKKYSKVRLGIASGNPPVLDEPESCLDEDCSRNDDVNPTEKSGLGKNNSNEAKSKNTGDNVSYDTDTDEKVTERSVDDLPPTTCYGSSSSWYTGSALDPESLPADTTSDTDSTFNRSGSKSLSKSKRVKNYIHKKYKDVANTIGSYAGVVGGGSGVVSDNDNRRSVDRQRRLTTSWYVESGVLLDLENNCVGIASNCDNNNDCVTLGQQQTLSDEKVDNCDQQHSPSDKNINNTASQHPLNHGNFDNTTKGSNISNVNTIEAINRLHIDNSSKSDICDNINIVAVDRSQSFGENRVECARFIDTEEGEEEDDDDDDNATITNEDEQLENMSCSSISLAADSESGYQEKPSDLECLVDKHLSRFYPNYSRTRAVLVRQARDLLVCEFGGDLARFSAEFILPAAQLLLPHLDAIQTRNIGCGPLGWPTCLGDSGLVLHLGELPAAQLKPTDIHLCVTSRPVQLAVVYWMGDRSHRCSTTNLPDTPLAAMDLLDNLPELLHDLVITVDREIERIPLEELAFPCLHCHELTHDVTLSHCEVHSLPHCQAHSLSHCQVTPTRDSCMQTCPTYEMDSSIPHIDSDEDVTDDSGYDAQRTPVNGAVTPVVTRGSMPSYHKSKHHVSTGTSTSNGYSYSKRSSVTHISTPKSISELPEGIVSESGIYLPGLKDVNGRAVIVYDMNTASNNALTARDVAKLLLYYSSIPLRLERLSSGMCLVIVETINSSSSSNASSTAAAIASVDHHKKLLAESLALLMPSQLKVSALLYYQNNKSSSTTRSSLLRLLNISSDIKCHVVSNSVELSEHLAEDQIPSACGGKSDHDQESWIKFFKNVEDLSARCQSCGRRLVALMGGSDPSVTSQQGTTSSARRQAHLQHRATARLLADPELHALRREAPAILKSLRETALWLPHSEDVRLWVEKAEKLYKEVDRAVQRLEALSEKRREKLRELARMRALEDETSEVLSWISEKGEDCLKRHAELATTLPAIKQQELDFEKFYFISMRHLDKGGDLLEEAKECSPEKGSGLKDLARSLKQHLRGFSERLEDTRERLEDTSRCFYLLDRAYEWALEAMKYMSRVKPEESHNSEQSVKQLKQYLMAHPPLSTDHFAEMLTLAKKLDNDKLLEQCKVAQCRCEETMEQIRSVVGAATATATDQPQPQPQPQPSWVTSTPIAGRRRSLPNHSSGSTATGHSCSCWDPGDAATIAQNAPTGPTPSAQNAAVALDEIREEPCSCFNNHHPLQRCSTWQYSAADSNYEEESSSNDNTTEGSEAGTKSGSENEDSGEGGSSSHSSSSNTNSKTPVPPIPVNSHLHCDLSLQLDNTGKCGTQTLKTKKTLLLIMREMIHTERDYVKSLEYVIENYIPMLVMEDIPQALRGQRNVVFGNIEKIYEFHSHFFLQELERCEQSPLLVGQCFLRHESKFYLYALYNKNKPKSDSLMSEYGTAFFKKKQLELGDRMDLGSYLLKPVQRMGKYALLLQQLMKASRQEVTDLRDAETMVRFQLRHGNDLLAMDSLRDCDVNVKEQGRLLRQNEFLVWQGKGKKCLRHVFLFEELILFSKARRFPDRKNLDIYIYKNSIKTSDIGMTARVGDSSTKFEIWFRKRKPNDTFTLQSMSEDVKQAWTEELSNILWKQALKNRG